MAAATALRREQIGTLRPVTSEPDVQIRCLDDYDQALGLSDRVDGGVA